MLYASSPPCLIFIFNKSFSIGVSAKFMVLGNFSWDILPIMGAGVLSDVPSKGPLNCERTLSIKRHLERIQHFVGFRAFFWSHYLYVSTPNSVAFARDRKNLVLASIQSKS